MDVIKFEDFQQLQQPQPGEPEIVKSANHWEPGESNQLQQQHQAEQSTLKHQDSTSCLNTQPNNFLAPAPQTSPFIGLSKFGVITSDKIHHRLINDNPYGLVGSYATIVDNHHTPSQLNCNHRRSNPLFVPPSADIYSKERHLTLPASVINSNSLDSANFIRRRNERERARVKNVNEGFDRLRKHLPLSPSQREKRLSKVETLRMAITYIRHLEMVLNSNEPKEER